MWTPDHLKNAYEGMTRFGADCYWASITGGDAFYYHFGVADLEKTETVNRLQEEPLTVELPDLSSAMLKNWSFLHLSCMVISRKLFETVRFDPALRLAAEDVLFFCDCVLASGRVILCDAPGAVRGEGINIFHGINNDSRNSSNSSSTPGSRSIRSKGVSPGGRRRSLRSAPTRARPAGRPSGARPGW